MKRHGLELANKASSYKLKIPKINYNTNPQYDLIVYIMHVSSQVCISSDYLQNCLTKALL
jgi:hypothetical protein